jgi:nucleoside-diphosphate-sugar epimerase
MTHPRLLITGCNGKIGRVLAPALTSSYEVYGLDVCGPFGDRVHRADIADVEQVDAVFEAIGEVDRVVHLAADARVKATWGSILNSNIVGTHNVYACARAHGVGRVVFASSNHVTGAYEGIPPRLHLLDDPPLITARDPIRPDSDYGTSKAFGEALARQFYEMHGVESICLRIGSFRADDDPTPDPRFMRTWISHRDLIQLVERSLQADVPFGVYYGVSDNRGRFWDIADARADLGYDPQDDASRLVE